MGKGQKIRILLTIVGISVIQALQYCVSPVLGQVQIAYPDISPTMVQLLLTIPSLPSMIMALISGWLVTKVSKKKMMLLGCLISGLAGILPFVWDGFEMLLFSRAFYGVGLGIAFVVNTSVVAEFFEGKERVMAMGIQSAAIGAGLIMVNAAGGFLGRLGYRYACLVSLLGFVILIIVAVCLPDTGKVQVTKENTIRLNATVFRCSIFILLETLFVTAYTTNIAMYVTEHLTADTGITGMLSSVFSATQLIAGLILGYVVKIAKRYTLPAAMFFLSIGGILIILFPSNFIMLAIGSLCCGFSQGVSVPQASVELTNGITPATVPLASAVFSCMMNFGQLIAPATLNTLSKVMLGKETTENAFWVMIVAAAVTSCIVVIIGNRNKKEIENKGV